MARFDRFLAAPVACLTCIGIFLMVLSGCAGLQNNWDSAAYTVKSGDTLYSIAWRYEIDHEELARLNNLSSPYIIHPGDRLRTRPADKKGAENTASVDNKEYPASSRQSVSQVTVRQGDTLYSLAKKNYMPAWKLAMINDLKQPYVLRPGQTLNLSGPVQASRSADASSSSGPNSGRQASTTSVQTGNASVHWRWPVRGKIISKFSRWKNDRKGIDIAGKRGTAIKAAAAGKVVYSGNSLINYGHLVIIKHSRDYLSAYANNRKLLVSEGETVKAGQKIAELGDAEAKSPYLHFEIRKKGKPVDPLRYLPRS